MGDARFDDEIWPRAPDNFLHRDHVLRILDDWATEPGKIVRVFRRHGCTHKGVSTRLQRLTSAVRQNSLVDFLVKTHNVRLSQLSNLGLGLDNNSIVVQHKDAVTEL